MAALFVIFFVCLSCLHSQALEPSYLVQLLGLNTGKIILLWLIFNYFHILHFLDSHTLLHCVSSIHMSYLLVIDAKWALVPHGPIFKSMLCHKSSFKVSLWDIHTRVQNNIVQMDWNDIHNVFWEFVSYPFHLNAISYLKSVRQ